MKTVYLIVGLACSGAFAVTQPSSPTWKGNLPFQTAMEVNVDKNQPCKVFMAINTGRILTLRSKYSNGKKVDGDNFITIATFLNSSGEPVYLAAQRAGLDAAGTGGAKERTIEDYKTISSDVIKKTSSISLTCSTIDKYKDEEIAKKIIGIVGEFFGVSKEETGRIFEEIVK